MGLYNAGLVFSLRPGGWGGAEGGEGGAVGQLSKSPLQCIACQAAHRRNRGLEKRSPNDEASAQGSPAKELGCKEKPGDTRTCPEHPKRNSSRVDTDPLPLLIPFCKEKAGDIRKMKHWALAISLESPVSNSGTISLDNG